MFDWIKIAIQKVIPQHFLSNIMFRIARIEQNWIKSKIIQFVVQHYKVNMQEALEPDSSSYRSFNDFFTRYLNPAVRPIDSAEQSIISPVDGVISQIGRISADQIIQAKGHSYSLHALLAGDKLLSSAFLNGHFATLYLSPKDYHRIHMPVAGRLTDMQYVPGTLFSVNALTVSQIPHLFARNERVNSIFETKNGPMAVIMVGAIFVGSMDTVWSGTIVKQKKGVQTTHYPKNSGIELQKGDEMGHFNMGSTVILLFPEATVEWEKHHFAGESVKMGEKLAHFSA